jgi:4-amino-4-deoxy-L-arabinose transferase-like glycosyltransferase
LTPCATRNQQRATLLILTGTLIAYAALAFGYATLTPIWQNPDEPAHYNYVAYVAETAGLPELRAGDWDLALLERLKNGQLVPGESVSSIRYEAWQPPLFYVLAAPIYRLTPTSDVNAVVLVLRAFNALIGAATLVVAFLVARDVLPWHLSVAVPLTIAGVPMFTSISTAVSADPLANLLSAVVLLVLMRRVRLGLDSTPGGRWAIGTGVLVGLGLLTKLALAIFVPLVLGVVVARSSRPVRQCALVLAAAALVVLPWLVHQVTTYGWSDPLATSRHAAVVLDQPRFPGLSLDYLGRFLTTSFHSFWAQFGWMGVVAPDRLYLAYGLLVLTAVSGLVLQRRLFREPAWLLVLATVGAALLAFIGYNLAFEQFQGRYLFTALVPIALLLVVGWAAWLPRRATAWGVTLVGILLLGLNAYALLRVLVPGFAPPG